jgi:hypothetical protein
MLRRSHEKALRLAWVLLLAVVWLQAQDQHAGTNPSDKNRRPRMQLRSKDVYKCRIVFLRLTDKSGMAYQIQGDSSALGEHVGHEVQITGTTQTASTLVNQRNRRHGLRDTADHLFARRETHLEDMHIR